MLAWLERFQSEYNIAVRRHEENLKAMPTKVTINWPAVITTLAGMLSGGGVLFKIIPPHYQPMALAFSGVMLALVSQMAPTHTTEAKE
jgi:hypothetical protein